MKVVLDTNVLISGIFWKGEPGKILEQWMKKKFELMVSEEIFQEYISVVELMSQKLNNYSVMPILQVIAINSHFVKPVGVEHPKCEDPDDDKFLAAATFSKAQYLVTGDKALLRVGQYPNGTVTTVSNFYQVISN